MRMEEQLTQVTTYKRTQNDSYIQSNFQSTTSKPTKSIATAREALKILQSEPNYHDLVFALKYITQRVSDINIHSPSPISSQIVHVLVSEIVPSFWKVFPGSDNQGKLKSSPEFGLLITCLRNLIGLNSVILHLKIYIQSSKTSNHATAQGPSAQEYLNIYLDLLEILLHDNYLIEKIWKSSIENLETSVKLTGLWKEILLLFGSGTIIGTCAEAEDLLHNLHKDFEHKYWFVNGRLYSQWLARNIVRWVQKKPITSEIEVKCCSELLGKSLSLGYPDVIIQELITNLLLQKDNYSIHFSKLCSNLLSSDQRKVLYSLLKLCSRQFLSSDIICEGNYWWKKDSTSISAVAALISSIITGGEIIKTHLLAWLTSNFGAGIGENISIRRSVLAAISEENHLMETVFEKCIEQFGDHLYIRHAPTLQQEVHCQVLLLTAGYIHRRSPVRLRMMVRSGSNLSLVSNRLAASSNRARFLGMVVGEALSALVDKPENKMDFKLRETNNSEAKWFKSLTEVEDSVGTITHLNSREAIENMKCLSLQDHMRNEEPISLKSKTTDNKKIEIIEIEKEDLYHDGLKIYTKPDSDAEDSDDDPTLINRDKLIIPVYIRDLIFYLRNNESFDHQRLGLSAAASLIRRKANFGTEVSDHAEEIATLLVGIQDKYRIENFSTLRLAGMIAILVAVPSKIGSWFSNTFFEGDYSISQRSSILTALSLGAREIAGLGTENYINSSNQSIEALFPSKMLSPSLEKYYVSQPSNQVDILSSKLERNMISPMVASLADKLTGPTILKIRTFSSRLEVEKKRPKPSVNKLSKIVGESFLYPLIGRFFIYSHSYTMSKRSVIFQPLLLSHFIKTLALILHAAGPYTPLLSQITAELWDILLGLRISKINERIVYEATCFAILTLLELNVDRSGLVQAQGRRLLETKEWVIDIISGLGEGDEDERCKMLAVGCMVKIQEIVENYQKVLLGSL